MKTTDETPPRRRAHAPAAAALAIVFTALAAFPASANGPLFSESFEAYDDGSNLLGQAGWDGLTNQGTAPEMPVTEGDLLPSGQVLNTRAIQEADRIHQIGHALPAFSADVVTTFSVRVIALADSINSGIGIGENPVPGPEIATNEGFFSTYRSGWYSTAEGWMFDMRGIAGNDDANLYHYTMGLGAAVTLRIVVDGPRRVIHGEFDNGTTVLTTPSRPISAGQIAELDAMAIFSDRSLSNRLGVEIDDIALTAVAGTDPTPCGDVNATGSLTAADALAVLKAAVGQPLELKCEPPAQPVKTGQTACYDEFGEGISCVGSGQDGEYQYGAARTFVDDGDGTIRDESTGLVWEKIANDGTHHDADIAFQWRFAFTDKIAFLNTSKFAGHDDWRLPNRAELETLANLAVSQPAIYAPFQTSCDPGCTVLTCSCSPPELFWTSTTFSEDPELAWAVSFADGSVVPEQKADSSKWVRAVRGGR